MMKKLLMIGLIAFGMVSPSFAQGGKERVLTRGVQTAISPDLPEVVGRNVLRATVSTPQVVRLKSTHVPPSANPPRVALKKADYRMRLPGIDGLHATIFPQKGQMYVPVAFTNHSNYVYRGMQLRGPEEIKNILLNGLETDKSSYWGEVYASPSLGIALRYALPNKYFFAKPGSKVEFPIIVRIQITEEVLTKLRCQDMGMEFVFYDSVPANMIQDVIVFAQINGRMGWYKVVMEDGELLLHFMNSYQTSDNDMPQPMEEW
ncbi:MAG: hypothetical protein IKP96_05780 [Elusimicrobiaceae bacterium]|nr:hypothetical protein [Elusimicrobiaceae bacterium]